MGAGVAMAAGGGGGGVCKDREKRGQRQADTGKKTEKFSRHENRQEANKASRETVTETPLQNKMDSIRDRAQISVVV